MRNSRAFVPASRLLGSTALGQGVMDLPRSIDELFDRFAGSLGAEPQRSWSPAVDVVENDVAFVVTMELPGVDPEQVEVTLDRDTLVVKGEKHLGRVVAGASDDGAGGEGAANGADAKATEAKAGSAAKTHRAEIIRGAFERRFTFGLPVAHDGVEATASHGVLTITVAKVVAAQPQRINVKAR